MELKKGAPMKTYIVDIVIDYKRGEVKKLTVKGTQQQAQDQARKYIADNHLHPQSVNMWVEAEK